MKYFVLLMFIFSPFWGEEDDLKLLEKCNALYSELSSFDDPAQVRASLNNFFREKIEAKTLAWFDVCRVISIESNGDFDRKKCQNILTGYRWALDEFEKIGDSRSVDKNSILIQMSKFSLDYCDWKTDAGLSVDEANRVITASLKIISEQGDGGHKAQIISIYTWFYIRFLSNTEANRRDEFLKLATDGEANCFKYDPEAYGRLYSIKVLCIPTLYSDQEIQDKVLENVGKYERLFAKFYQNDPEYKFVMLDGFYDDILRYMTGKKCLDTLRTVGLKRINLLNEHEKNHDKSMAPQRKMETYSKMASAFAAWKATPGWRKESMSFYRNALEEAEKIGHKLSIATYAKEMGWLAKEDDQGEIPEKWNTAIKYLSLAVANYPSPGHEKDMKYCYAEMGYSYLSRNRVRNERMPALNCYEKALACVELYKNEKSYEYDYAFIKHQLAFCKYELFDDVDSMKESIQQYDEAIRVREKINDFSGLANSYKRKSNAVIKRDVLIGSASEEALDSLGLAFLSLVKNGQKSDAVFLVLSSLDAYSGLLMDKGNINEDVRVKIFKIINDAFLESQGVDKNLMVMCDVMRIRFRYFFEKHEEYILELRKLKEMTEQQGYDPRVKAIISKQLEGMIKESEKF